MANQCGQKTGNQAIASICPQSHRCQPEQLCTQHFVNDGIELHGLCGLSQTRTSAERTPTMTTPARQELQFRGRVRQAPQWRERVVAGQRSAHRRSTSPNPTVHRPTGAGWLPACLFIFVNDDHLRLNPPFQVGRHRRIPSLVPRHQRWRPLRRRPGSIVDPNAHLWSPSSLTLAITHRPCHPHDHRLQYLQNQRVKLLTSGRARWRRAPDGEHFITCRRHAHCYRLE